MSRNFLIALFPITALLFLATGLVTYPYVSEQLGLASEEVNCSRCDVENGGGTTDSDNTDDVTSDSGGTTDPTDSENDLVTFYSADWGIQFQYPREYSVDYRGDEIAVMVDLPSGVQESTTDLVLFSKEFQPDTYTPGVPNEVDTDEFGPATVDGATYQFDKYIMGEGFNGSSFYEVTYNFTLNENLHISALDVNTELDCSLVNPDIGRESHCEKGPGSYEYDTPDEDLANALDIIDSLTLIEE